MPDILIHIGTHKTGTTSIQHSLRQTATSVGSAELTYLELSGQQRVALMQAGHVDRRLVDRMGAELSSQMKGNTRKWTILSSEQLSGNPFDGYLNSRPVASMLREATQPWNVKIIVYLRRQDQFIESIYSQTIHEGGSGAFEDFLAGFGAAGSLDYDRFLTDWRDLFGEENLVVRSYNQAASHGLIDDFSEVIGYRVHGEAVSMERSNPSYSHHALHIARLANQLLADDRQKRQLRKAMRKTMVKARGEEFSHYAQDSRQQLWGRFFESNQAVADRYFGGDLSKLFPPPQAAAPPAVQEGDLYEQVAKLITEILNQQSQTSLSQLMGGLRAAARRIPVLNGLLRRSHG